MIETDKQTDRQTDRHRGREGECKKCTLTHHLKTFNQMC